MRWGYYVIVDYQGGLNGITSIVIRGGRRARIREGDMPLEAEVRGKQGRQKAPRRRKVQGTDSPLEPPEGTRPCCPAALLTSGTVR